MSKLDEKTQAKLAELETAHAEVKEAADRVPGLEKELEEANGKVASLQKQLDENQKSAEDSVPALTEDQATKTADLLVERGLLKAEQKEAFASQIKEDPSQLCESIEKIAEFAVAAQMGEPGAGDPALKVAQLDPIAAFAMGE